MRVILASARRMAGTFPYIAKLNCLISDIAIHSTTGGTGGTTTTVADLASFTAAVGADGPTVVVLDGAISGAAKVEVTSDKTIIGNPGSSMSSVI